MNDYILINMKNPYYRIAFFILIQIASYVCTYELGWRLGVYLKDTPKNDIFWGITVRYSLIAFIIISIISTILTDIFFNKTYKQYLIVFAISFVAFSLLFISNYRYTPNKVLLLLISAFIGFSSSIVIRTIKPL